MLAEKRTAQIAWQGSAQVRRFQEEMARRRSEEARRIGGRIAALRERHHLTQEAAAAKLKVAYRTYQSWEQGTSVPRWATRERIAKFYGVSVEEINGPAAPAENASTSTAERLERIEQSVNEIHALLVGDGAHEADFLEGLADRLLRGVESPPKPTAARKRSRPATPRRKTA